MHDNGVGISSWIFLPELAIHSCACILFPKLEIVSSGQAVAAEEDKMASELHESSQSKLRDSMGSVMYVLSHKTFGLDSLRFIKATERWKLENTF